uniref:ATP-dependent DNA helicase n=1 Tax=Glycine max TaxID=3847 RepID=A0A0R0GEJ6_SOYBN
MFFLYGYGGTGKTFIWKTLASSLKANKKIVIMVASSGITSLLLPRARTAHSKFKIPIPIFEDSTYIGDGIIGHPNDGYATIEIPQDLLIIEYDDPIHAIVNSIFPYLCQHHNNTEFFQSRAILASTNETVQQVNDYILSLISSEHMKYPSSDSVDKSETIESCHFSSLTTEFLNSLATTGMPNHSIKLKIRSPIMLLRNLDQTQGLCNGTRLIVTRLANHVIATEIIYGKNIGHKVYIPKMSMSSSQSS